MKKFFKENRKGFTLIELLVVIAILAVLATLYVPRILTSTTNAKKTVAIANARTLASEITMYNIEASQNSSKHIFVGGGTKTTTGHPDWLTDSRTYVLAADFEASETPAEIKSLLNGRQFPDPTVVLIMIEPSGSCYLVNPADGEAITEAYANGNNT